MIRRRRMEMTLERERVLIVSGSAGLQTWCSVCQKETRMIPVDEAALRCQVSSRTIFGWVDEGKLHFIETTNRLLRICIDSLP